MFIVKMMSGEIYKVTESEYQTILLAENGVLVPRLKNVFINKKSISTAYSEEMASEVDEKQQNTGVLHDGTRVKKHFGDWIVANAGEIVRIDPHYYPEVARGCVLTEKEFEKVVHLPPAERIKYVKPNSEIPKIVGTGNSKVNPINGIIETIKDKYVQHN